MYWKSPVSFRPLTETDGVDGKVTVDVDTGVPSSLTTGSAESPRKLPSFTRKDVGVCNKFSNISVNYGSTDPRRLLVSRKELVRAITGV